MLTKLQFRPTFFGLMLAFVTNARLFSQETGGGPGEGGGPPPVPCSCTLNSMQSCKFESGGIQGLPPIPGMQWPGEGTTPPEVECSIGHLPTLGLYRTCYSSTDCPTDPAAQHQVSENDWNTSRVVPVTPGPFHTIHWNGSWGYWGTKTRPADPFECQWRTDCTKCQFAPGTLTGSCRSRTYAIRELAQIIDCSEPPCWIPKLN